MAVEDYEKYLDRYWRGGEITMTNHLTGKSTVLHWTDYEFGRPTSTSATSPGRR